MNKRQLLIAFVLFDLIFFGSMIALLFTPIGHRVKVKLFGGETVQSRVQEFGPASEERWRSRFRSADVIWPPSNVTLVADKSKELLHVYSNESLVCTLPVVKMSGRLGPKLKEGDRQVPEGVYEIQSLNPNSAYHVSLRLNYPNAGDVAAGCTGSDIMIHGKNKSVGCLAMGDEAAEDLFYLAFQVGLSNVTVLLCPVDFRDIQYPAQTPVAETKYAVLRERLSALESVP